MRRAVVVLLLLLCALCAAAETPGMQVTLTASNAASLAGTLVTFTATVTGTPASTTAGAAAPTGSVTFLDGKTAIGAGALAENNGLATAVLYTAALTAGSHTITAQYAGDANFAAAVSAAVTVSVASYSITPSTTSLTLRQGQSGTILYTVADGSGGGTNVQFACQAPAGTYTECSFNPAAVAGNGKAVLTISTSGAAQTTAREGAMGLFVTGSGALASLLLCWSPFGAQFRRRLGDRALLSALILAVLLCGIAALYGCGGGAARLGMATATPAGTQTFEVITSATANSQTVSQDTWVAVSVIPAS